MSKIQKIKDWIKQKEEWQFLLASRQAAENFAPRVLRIKDDKFFFIGNCVVITALSKMKLEFWGAKIENFVDNNIHVGIRINTPVGSSCLNFQINDIEHCDN